ncbi:MAG: hypothetical protein V3V30_06135 [Parvularculaceae bacterium]
MKRLFAGDPVEARHIDHIYAGVQVRSLPKSEWTHCAHLVAGAAMIDEVGLAGAEQQMPDIIRAYNEATGVENSNSDGYHHTITIFMLREIDGFLRDQADQLLSAKVTALLKSDLTKPDYMFRYFTKEHLFSVPARRDWVEPDRTPEER